MPANDPNDPLIPPAGGTGSPPSPAPAAAPMSATSAVPTGSQAVVGGVGELETVSGQLDKVLDKDSPLIQRSRASAQEQATSRGLQNSTMAAQAGELAAIQSALPIASADAGTYANRASQNLSTVNQFGLQEAQVGGQLRLGEQSRDTQLQLGEQGIAGQIRVNEADTNNRMTLLTAEGQQRATLLAQEGAQRLQEISAQTGAQERLQTLDQNFRLLQQDKAAGYDIQLEDRRFQTQSALLVAEYAQRMNLSTMEQTQQIERLNIQHVQTLEQISAQAEAAKATDVAPRLGSQYLAAVSERMQQSSNEISSIYQTQGLSASQQQSAVANAYARVQTDLQAIAAYYQQSPNWDPAWASGGNAVVPQAAQPAPTDPYAGLIPDYYSGIAGF